MNESPSGETAKLELSGDLHLHSGKNTRWTKHDLPADLIVIKCTVKSSL